MTKIEHLVGCTKASLAGSSVLLQRYIKLYETTTLSGRPLRVLMNRAKR